MNEIVKLKSLVVKTASRIKSGSPRKGDKAMLKTLRGDIKTLEWVLTP